MRTSKNKLPEFIKELQRFEHELDAIGRAIRNEEKIYREELEERLRLGLTGNEAIEHYNAWMVRNGLKKCTIK